MDSSAVEGRKPRFLTKMVVIGGLYYWGSLLGPSPIGPLNGPPSALFKTAEASSAEGWGLARERGIDPVRLPAPLGRSIHS